MELVKAADLLSEAGHNVIHLSIGEPDFPMAAPIREAFCQAALENRTRYTSALGLQPLREAIAEHYERAFSVKLPASRIVVTSGASAALMYACLALINPGDEVLLTDPGYPCNKTFIQMAGGTPTFITTDEAHNFQPKQTDLLNAWNPRTTGALLASPTNPTGTQLSLQAMQGLLLALHDKHGFLIMDEIYQSLTYDTAPHSVLQLQAAHSEACPVVVVNSFSKYFGMTGLRLGWMVVPPHLLETVERLAQNLSICPNTPSQWAALACFQDNTLDICEQRRQLFATRRDFMVKELPRAGIALNSRPDSAFYVYAQSPYESDRYCAELLQQGLVCTVPGKDFSAANGQQMLRLSYANSLDNLELALDRIQTFNRGR